MSPCRICERETRPRTPEFHVLEVSPIDPELCTGCWIGLVQFELFLMRAGRYVGIGPKAADLLKENLGHFRIDEDTGLAP